MLKNRFAKGSNGIVDINELTDATRYDFGLYECYGCGNELIPKLGKKNTWHFAHKIDLSCSPETYLHLVSKKLFAQTYSECLAQKTPYFMEVEKIHTCNQFPELFSKNPCKKTISERVDLTRFYDKIEIEKPTNGFIPDILLSSSNGKQILFIEIAVTHPCDEKKINSKNKILEFEIKSEDDLKIFKEHTIDTRLPNIMTYNFRSKEISNICNSQCENEIAVFIVYQSKKCIITDVKAKEIYKLLNNKKVAYYDIILKDDNKIFKDKIREAHMKNVHILNCYLCKYHGGSTYSAPVFCKYLKKEVKTNAAFDCEYYRTVSKIEDYIKIDADNKLFSETKQLNQKVLVKEKAKQWNKEAKEKEKRLKKEARDKKEKVKKQDDMIKAFNKRYLQQMEERNKT